MIIDRIYVKSFGNLVDFEFFPHRGLNVIHGENESGKSTLAAFIKFMFYGFSPKRSQNAAVTEAERYINWDTHSAGGVLEFTASDGTPYRIEREVFRSGKKNSEDLTIIDLNSGNTLTDSAHDIFLGGISEDVFNRTVFISQASGTAVDSDAVYTSVENMLTGADEEVNTKKALSKLDSARISLLYKNEKGGRIYNLRNQIEALNEKRLASAELSRHILKLRADIDSDAKAMQEIKESIKNAEAYIDALESAERLERIKATVKNEEAIKHLEEERDKYAKEETYNGFFPKKEYLSRLDAGVSDYYSTLERMVELGKKRDRLKEKYEEDTQKSPQNLSRIEPIVRAVSAEDKKRLKLYRLGIYSLIALGVFGTAFIISLIALPSMKLLTGALAVVSGLFFVAFRLLMRSSENTIRNLLSSVGATGTEDLKLFRNSQEKTSEYRDQLAKQIGQTESDIRDCEENLKKTLESYTYLSEKYGTVCKSISDCEEFRKRVSTVIDNLDRFNIDISRKKEEFRLNSEDFTEEEYSELSARDIPVIPAGSTIRSMLITKKSEKRELESTLRDLSSGITDNKVRLSSMIAGFEDEESLNLKIQTYTSQLERLLFVYEAISLASSSLEKASAASRSRIAPRLSCLSSEIISNSTNGKYDKINVDTKLNISYSHNESTRDIAFLSEGTKDIVYIAFRISLISTLFKDKPPIIIDEGFAGMDDERLRATLEAVKVHAKNEKAQILIFSPTKREAAAASAMGAYVFTMPCRD